MHDFTIRQIVDADVVQIVESMSHSGGPPIAPSLPADNILPDIFSFNRPDTTESDQLPCHDN
jgi:hypothetical protein